jgi:hypothetical protein
MMCRRASGVDLAVAVRVVAARAQVEQIRSTASAATKWGHGLLQVRSAVRIGSVAVRDSWRSVVGSSSRSTSTPIRPRCGARVAGSGRAGRGCRRAAVQGVVAPRPQAYGPAARTGAPGRGPHRWEPRRPAENLAGSIAVERSDDRASRPFRRPPGAMLAAWGRADLVGAVEPGDVHRNGCVGRLTAPPDLRRAKHATPEA